MLLLIPFSFFLAPFFYKIFKNSYFIFLIFVCIATTLLLYFSSSGILQYTWFNLNRKPFLISFLNDDLTKQLVLLVNFIGACVAFYSQFYFSKSTFRYWIYLSIFIGSMQGLIISHHALMILIFWELVGVSSFLLIGYYFEQENAVYGSSKALWLNKIGDIGFLIGILGLSVEYKSLDITKWTELGPIAQEKSWILWFFILGALAKSAQGPFMIWLPDAMAGPTPASALIHAATMVAAGIYLLFRLQDIFTPEVKSLFLWLGTLTALLGAIYALFQLRIKTILAGSTISQLGWMLSALGTSFPYTAIEHLWAHAFFKAGLFLAAGYIIHCQKNLNNPSIDSQDIRYMGHFYYKNPALFWFFGLLLFALMGFPFTSGFLTKEAILAAHNYSFTFYILLLSALFTNLYAFKVLFSLKKNPINHQKFKPFKDFKFTVTIYLLAICSLFFLVSKNPLHIDKPLMPEVSVFISIASLSTFFLAWLIFKKFSTHLLKLNSELVNNFWGLNYIYDIWITQNFITRIEYVKHEIKVFSYKVINPILWFSYLLKWLEEKILDGLILMFKSLFVTGKWMGLPVSIAHFFQWMDTFVWDFSIHGLSYRIVQLSKNYKQISLSSIQIYLLYGLGGVLLGIILFKYL